ncbi:MAG: hypothetical protein AB1689_22395 [Thermodesulfobacteriota bacterium]
MAPRRPSLPTLLAVTLALACPPPLGAQTEPVTPRDQEFPLDVDLDDRVDPVPPGGEIVYEVEIENFTAQPAPDVVVTVHPPQGTTFVVAHREPDWAEVTAQVFADRVELALGDVPTCDLPGVARCRDVWLVLALDPGVEPGTVLENRVGIASSDAVAHPPNEAATYTTAGAAAVRASKVFVGRPLRDRFTIEADIGRSGLRTLDDPPTPTIELGAGIRVVFGEAGATPLLDVTVPAADLRCTNPDDDPSRNKTCALRDPKKWRLLGLQKLQVLQRPYRKVQRNNAQLRVRGAFLDIPPSVGNDFELTVEAGGEVYADVYTVEPAPNGRFRRYAHAQGQP